MRYLFVINSNKTAAYKSRLLRRIKKKFGEAEYQCIYTSSRDDAIKQIKAKASEIDVVVAIGGDGAVNSALQAVADKNLILAIIPQGSGNGFARALKIPLKITAALTRIKTGVVSNLDLVKLNELYFANVAGFGFDAYVSRMIEGSKKRGFLGYARIIIKSALQYKARELEVQIEDKNYKFNPFILSIANGSQFGFNAKISPKAIMNDGKLELVYIKKIPWYLIPKYMLSLFNGKIDSNKGVETIKVANLDIVCLDEEYVHLDGEIFTIPKGERVRIRIKQQGLRVIF